jgi:hypothetical protein
MWKQGVKGISHEYKKRDHWDDPGDAVEKALLLKALRNGVEPTAKIKPELSKIKNELEKYTLNSFFQSGDYRTDSEDRVPVLRAAATLEALSVSPGSSTSSGALAACFRILHSFFAAKPEELTGGARAGNSDAPQTAFITWRCVRSVICFAKTFEATASLVDHLKNLEAGLPSETPSWAAIAADNRKLLAEIETKKLKQSLLVDPLISNHDPEKDTAKIQENIRLKLKAGAKVNLSIAADNKTSLEESEGKLLFNFAYDKSKTLLDELKSKFAKASRLRDLGELADALREMSKLLKLPLTASASYLRYVLDQELVSSVMQPQRVPDAAELAFAAAGLELLDPTEGNRCRAALDKVVRLITDTGRVPSHRPFDTTKKGYVVHVAGMEVYRAFAELAYGVEYPVEFETAERILKYFEDGWKEEYQGWEHERAQTRTCSWWLSAIGVNALESYARMLDRRINQIIFGDLSVRQPADLKVPLEELFYADFGLVAAGIQEKSVCAELARMFAQVSGLKLDNQERLLSAVLYGPPGTGKTTLVEALACSAKAPLVEITPSDILLGGQEKIETRARVVFEALSMLSEVVIILDEFDRVLWDRSQAGESDTIFQFLTPGMLPKLKKLYEAAKDQKIAFVLSTNLVGGLDSAAIREGRFDAKIGVYPPDALSRVGQFCDLLGKKRIPIDPKRFEKVIEETAGRGMNSLAKRGWFLVPEDEPASGTPIKYLSDGIELRKWPQAEKELPIAYDTDYPPRKRANDGGMSANSSFPNKFAKIDWKAWKFVECLDRLYKEKKEKVMLEKIDEFKKNDLFKNMDQMEPKEWGDFVEEIWGLKKKDASASK